MTMTGPLLGELQQEAAVTRRVLERVPGDKLAWKPHAKSMTLGELAMHVATIPGNIAKLAMVDTFDASTVNFAPPNPKDTAEILSALDASLKEAQDYLGEVSDSTATADWRMIMNGKEAFRLPRIAMLRTIMFNHWYHHRGQLSVYLRLLEVPLPSIYGPSADENPFRPA